MRATVTKKTNMNTKLFFKTSLFIATFIFGCLLISGCMDYSSAQKEQSESGQNRGNPSDRFKAMEERALKEAFRGVETSDGKVKDLFPIRATGVSTAPIQKAADAFLNSLSDEQKKKVLFPIDDNEWRKWSNVDNGIYKRQGISLKEMSDEQKQVAFSLMKASLSAKGLQLSRDIMKTDQTLKEIQEGDEAFDEELYFFTIMGEPSDEDPWGWQVDGHHLVVNYFILGDQIVMTPVFMGGEPIMTTSGKYKGNTILQDEQNNGLKFMQSLSNDLQKEATVSSEKRRSDNKAEANKDNITLDYEGVSASKFNDAEKKAFLDLISIYIGNIRDEHAKVKMEEIKEHIDKTYFSWQGKTTDDAVFYYRIHSPVILIEFDHQGPIGVKERSRNATRNHIHTVVRTPNGNDYGKDLLRQHLEKHHKK